MKRVVLVVALAIILTAALVSGSIANFTHEDTARNAITTGGISFEIHETMETEDGVVPFPEDGIEFLPGDEVSKIVKIENTSGHPMYLRVKLIKAVVDHAELSAEECLHVNIDPAVWTDGGDGYYYYNEPVAANTETAPLFTKVLVDGLKVDNQYLGKQFSLKIKGEAVQSENNGANVMEATGWSVDD